MVVRSNCSRSPSLAMRKPALSMINAVVASLFSTSSRNSRSSRAMSSSMSWGRLAMSRVLRTSLADEFVQQHAGDHVERLEDALALVGRRGERGHLNIPVVQQEFEVFHGGNVRQVALVVLNHVGNFRQVELERFEVLFQVDKALYVLGHFLVLRISNEDNAIHAAQHKLAGGVVDHLAGNGVKLELGLEALDGHGLDGQEIEEQGAIRTGCQRNQLALVALGGLNVIMHLD